ncbi:MAG: 1,6-anhydro-N-acetylmuramyl-L-alanine amidase AmpD [Gammaproteobacteria bacterium]|nr:1,6-anhydro-N-acetylmuramyl-L-alanine amidase AmpD [Gammaproteobacteria bacterium]
MTAATRATIDPVTGLLRGVRQVLSPHFNRRPQGQQPDLIVVHGISLPPGEYGERWVDRFFCGNLPPDAHPYFAKIASLRVSAHAMIARDGCITQYVSFHERAWHAGESSYAGRSGCNDFSIGIELEGGDDAPYEDAQYVVLADLIKALRNVYVELTHDRIAGHNDIAPGRKSDPGLLFDWSHLQRLLAHR